VGDPQRHGSGLMVGGEDDEPTDEALDVVED
jgi:hypothetical protein